MIYFIRYKIDKLKIDNSIRLYFIIDKFSFNIFMKVIANGILLITSFFL